MDARRIVGEYDDRRAGHEAARAGGKARAELGMLLNDLDWRNDRQAEQGRPARMNVAWTARELATAAR